MTKYFEIDYTYDDGSGDVFTKYFRYEDEQEAAQTFCDIESRVKGALINIRIVDRDKN